MLSQLLLPLQVLPDGDSWSPSPYLCSHRPSQAHGCALSHTQVLLCLIQKQDFKDGLTLTHFSLCLPQPPSKNTLSCFLPCALTAGFFFFVFSFTHTACSLKFFVALPLLPHVPCSVCFCPCSLLSPEDPERQGRGLGRWPRGGGPVAVRLSLINRV